MALVCAAVNVASIRCVPMVFDADALYMIGTFFNGRDALPKETKDMRDMIDTWRNVGQCRLIWVPLVCQMSVNVFIVFTPNARIHVPFQSRETRGGKSHRGQLFGTNYELRVNYPSILAKGGRHIRAFRRTGRSHKTRTSWLEETMRRARRHTLRRISSLPRLVSRQARQRQQYQQQHATRDARGPS